MGIQSRFSQENVTDRYSMPQPLLSLFDNVLPIGSILDRRTFFSKHLPAYESNTVEIANCRISIRPAWNSYYNAPRTHLIVVGHILFCHVFQDRDWYHQPSMRLFSQEPKIRMERFKELVSRASHYGSPAAMVRRVS